MYHVVFLLVQSHGVSPTVQAFCVDVTTVEPYEARRGEARRRGEGKRLNSVTVFVVALASVVVQFADTLTRMKNI
jgi:hypothetical protein